MDAESGLYLEEDNPDERLPMAATILIMTALVVLEEQVDPAEEVTISEEACRREPGTEEIGGFFCGYLSGEAWRYRTNDC